MATVLNVTNLAWAPADPPPEAADRLGSPLTPSPLPHPAADISNIWPELSQSFPPEIDEEANSYFQQIYNQPPSAVMSVDEVLQMLKRFKDSPVKKERVGSGDQCPPPHGKHFALVSHEKTMDISNI